MVNQKKRRSSGRGKHPKRASAQVVVVETNYGWAREVGAVIAVVCASLLIFSLASELYVRGAGRPLDDVAAAARNNLMGPAGHILATMLLGALGWCGFLPAVWLLGLAGVLYFRPNYQPDSGCKQFSLFVVWLGLIASFVFFASFCAVLGGRLVGGTVGIAVSEPLIKYFNPLGASFITGTFFFLSLGFATRSSIGLVIKGGIARLLGLISKLPAIVLLMVKSVFGVIGWLIGLILGPAIEYLKGFVSRRADDDEEVLPRPRRHRSYVQIEDDDEDGQDGDDFLARQKLRLEAVIVKRRNQKHIDKKIDKIRLIDKGQTVAEDGDKYANYEMPSLSLLTRSDNTISSEDDHELRQKSKQIENKLKDFGIAGHITEVHPGPVITLFEFEPAPGVKVGKIAALQDDMAMALRASSIRIVAPIPKKGTVGIEVPNKIRDVVRLRDVLESDAFINSSSILSTPIGKDTYGDPVIADIATMPHLLIAGATGTGKSVFLNALLLSLLYRATPAEMGLIMIDPKILELSVYEGIPHLRVPVVTAVRQAKAVLEWSVHEMNRRYRLMQRFGVRGIDGYNQMVNGDSDRKSSDRKGDKLVALREQDVLQSGTVEPDSREDQKVQFVEKLQPLPKLVIVIDELADLMLSVGREVEELITRLAQKGRAAGLHLIVATQRPSVDVITGLIKANFPARISFRVPSRIDSRTILDQMGSERLLGRGDMLFMLPGIEGIKRVHGAFISDGEVKRVVAALKDKCSPHYDQRIIEVCQKALEDESAGGNSSGGSVAEDEYDQFYDKAVELVVQKGQASTSMVQRAFRIGYNRAARIIDLMERDGVVGPMDGVRPRQVLVSHDTIEPGTDVRE